MYLRNFTLKSQGQQIIVNLKRSFLLQSKLICKWELNDHNKPLKIKYDTPGMVTCRSDCRLCPSVRSISFIFLTGSSFLRIRLQNIHRIIRHTDKQIVKYLPLNKVINLKKLVIDININKYFLLLKI